MPTSTDLIVRLNRIEGQVQALKAALERGAADADCAQTLYQVKAAANALKRFGEAFTREYARHCLAENMSRARLAHHIDGIISSAFALS